MHVFGAGAWVHFGARPMWFQNFVAPLVYSSVF